MERQQRPASRHYLRTSCDKIGPEDPRYPYLVHRGFNRRFTGKPDHVRLVGSTEDVVEARQEAVSKDFRIAVRSGGHCLDGLFSDSSVGRGDARAVRSESRTVVGRIPAAAACRCREGSPTAP